MFDRWLGRMAGYNSQRLRGDLMAGLILGLGALPLAMAFAIASGAHPERGLYTAIIAGSAISLFGASKVQIGGPTGAMTTILSLISLQYGLNNLLLAGFLAGLTMVLMGVFRIGALIHFVPYPVAIGFTAGIAVIIFAGQLSNFLGLTGLTRHEHFHLNLLETLRNLAAAGFPALATAVVALACVVLTPKLSSKIPGSLVGMLFATVLATYLDWPRERHPVLGNHVLSHGFR